MKSEEVFYYGDDMRLWYSTWHGATELTVDFNISAKDTQ